MSKRQDIIDAVKTRLGTIKVTGGYYSNLGNNIYEWRDTDTSPIPVGNLPASHEDKKVSVEWYSGTTLIGTADYTYRVNNLSYIPIP